MADVFGHLNQLNVTLQGKGVADVFVAKKRCFQTQVKSGDFLIVFKMKVFRVKDETKSFLLNIGFKFKQRMFFSLI